MTLYNFLKQFKNICWYPSAFKDSLSMVCLSYNNLQYYGISKYEAPDCFIFTDYDGHSEKGKFFLEANKEENELPLNYINAEHTATAFNIKELKRLKIGFDQELVSFDKDENYGRVFIADVLVEHPVIGKSVTKLVYVITENTKFAFDYLLKKKITIKYVVHSRYGHGFGGGISCGSFLCNILKDLNAEYLVSDMNDYYRDDIADKYLNEEQRRTIPIIREIVNFNYRFGWVGYEPTVLYKITRYDTTNIGFFGKPKFKYEERRTHDY